MESTNPGTDGSQMATTVELSTKSGMTLMKQGAEARIYRSTYVGRKSIVKERFKKLYRHPQLDAKLSQRRTGQEVRTIMRCRKAGISTPVVYFVDNESHSIHMEFIGDSLTVREYVQQIQATDTDAEDPRLLALASKIGKTIASMHAVDVIHGDLTTSNMLLQQPCEDSQLILIDFGLSQISHLCEDKGVDLYVLERAFLSTHPNTEKLFEKILDIYAEHYKKSAQVLKKLEEVRQRGRKREMIG